MNLTFDRRYNKWDEIRKYRERCDTCMYDAPHEDTCCKHHCGKYQWCNTCNAKCRNTSKLCEK